MEQSLNNSSNNSNNHDDKLAQLLGLGFDIEVCRAALLRNDSIQSATEWILGNESVQTSSRQPVLSLRPDSLRSSQPLPQQQQEHLPSMAQHQISSSTENTHGSSGTNRLQEDNNKTEEADRLRNESMKLLKEAKMEKKRDREARERALAQINEDKERRKLFKNTQVIESNTSNGSSSSTIDQQSAIKEYEKAQQEIKKQRRLDREAKSRTLKEIQQDRENMKLRHHHKQPTSISSTTGPGTVEGSSKPLNNKKNARIQFKLSDGSTVRQQFQADTLLSELYAFAREKENDIGTTPMGNNPLRLISAFPKQEFVEGEKIITVQAAGFIPNVSLNVVRPVAEEGQENPNENVRDHDNDIIMRNAEEEGNDGEDQQPSSEQEQQGNGTINRDNVASATEGRKESTLYQQEQQSEQFHARGRARSIRSLRDTCAVSVTAFLTQHTPEAHTRIKHLLYASSRVADLLLSQLIDTEKLNRLTMQKLADHCYLQNVCLDYTSETDSLLQELSLSNSSSTVTKLSLKGCEVIVDPGIRSIGGLRNLEYLDASNCTMTNKGIKFLTKLSHLQYLNLSKTKISDIGLQYMVENAYFKDSLEVLLIDGCSVIKSNDILLLINNAFPRLVTLGLASTGMGRQTVVSRPKLEVLQYLDISNTKLTDEDAIQTICVYKTLRELKLSGCHEISLRGLSYFARDLRNLEMIQFPSREHDLDSVLPRYADLPLRHLDLTSFQVTDEGADSIAKMKNLEYLSLDGTKITDEGVSKLSGLINLRKLFLDRTTVSDEGISQLKGLTKLGTLSLSRTQVTNSLLILLGDFEKTGFTRSLSTLNLAQCQHISDIGIRGLKGMVNLKSINLDHTNVSRQCLRHLQNLEYLKPVRLLGIERDEDEQEIALV